MAPITALAREWLKIGSSVVRFVVGGQCVSCQSSSHACGTRASWWYPVPASCGYIVSSSVNMEGPYSAGTAAVNRTVADGVGERGGCERRAAPKGVAPAEVRGEAEGARDELSGAVDAAALPPTGSRVQAAEQLYNPILSVTEAAKLQRDVRSTQRRALHMPRQSSRGFG